MRTTVLFFRVTAFVVALLATLGSLAMTVATAWVAVATGEPEIVAAADRRWGALVGVSILGIAVSLWTAHRLREAAARTADDEPILWI